MTATRRIPEIATLHAQALFYEVMEFFSTEGLIDFTDEAARGGEYVYKPRVGQMASKPAERSNVASLSSGATVRSTANKQENMIVLRRQKFTEWYDYEPLVAGMLGDAYDNEIARQMAIMFAQSLLVDIYRCAIGTAQIAGIDHEHNVYVDTATAGDQVDFTASVLQAGKFKMTDQMETLDIGVCHSKQWNDSRIEDITDGFSTVPNIVGDVIRGVLFRNKLGVTWIVDDQMPTVSGSNAVRYQALMLRSRGRDRNGRAPISVSLQRPLEFSRQHVQGEQQTRRQFQGFADWAIGVPGASWDVTAGGANPTDANLLVSTNWDESAQDDDEMHGIINVGSN